MFGFTQKDRELIQAIAKRQDDQEKKLDSHIDFEKFKERKIAEPIQVQTIAKRQDDEEYTITGALTNPLEIGNLAKKLNPILKEYGVVKILMTRNDLLI